MCCTQVTGTDLQATVQFANDSDVGAPNATLTSFVAAVSSGTFDMV